LSENTLSQEFESEGSVHATTYDAAAMIRQVTDQERRIDDGVEQRTVTGGLRAHFAVTGVAHSAIVQ
jgi:hypothetical protein